MKFRFLSILIIAYCLGACSHQSPSTGQQQLIQQLRAEGVAVNTVGETVDIILPSDQVFNSNSANIVPEYRPVLKKVASLVKSYILVSVQVTGYTDASAEAADLKALTEKQAQRVASYLWAHGIDARLVYATGQGNLNPVVVTNGSLSASSPNRRVEVVFRYYPSVSHYD